MSTKEEKNTIRNTNILRLKNTLLNNQQITEEIKICIETNENENMTTPNLWDSVKVVLRGRFIEIQVYLKKQERNQINKLTLQKYRSMEQNRKPKDKSMDLWAPYLQQRRQEPRQATEAIAAAT